MYFAVLHLFLLFASAIWASPVHIGRRMMFHGVNLPNDKCRFDLYSKYEQAFHHYGKDIEGVPSARKLDVWGNLLVRIKPLDEDVGRVKNMIDNLGEALLAWEWGVHEHFIIFEVTMKTDGEGKLNQYLGKHNSKNDHLNNENDHLTGTMANMSLEPTHDAHHSKI